MSGFDINITKSLGAFDIALDVKSGAGITALFGRSGAGKTSIIRMIAGLMTPDAGRILLNDRVVYDGVRGINLSPQARRIGVVFQDARLFPHMSVMQNLCFGGTHNADQTIKMLGLGDLLDRKPADLSGGEKQRVAIGRALMMGPDLLALDEPLAALDAERRAQILPYLERLRDTVSMPIIYVSHAMDEVARLASNLVILDQGRAALSGPIGDVLGDPASLELLVAGQAGGLLHGVVAGFDAQTGLSRIALSDGEMMLTGRVGEVGKTLRLHVPAHEIILSATRPTGLSALNILPVTVQGLSAQNGDAMVVALTHGQDRLLARITAHSSRALRLKIGSKLFAIVKATTLDQRWFDGSQP